MNADERGRKQGIKTHAQLRTMRSLRINTGAGRASWPRVQETERLKGQPRLNLRRLLSAWPRAMRRAPCSLPSRSGLATKE